MIYHSTIKLQNSGEILSGYLVGLRENHLLFSFTRTGQLPGQIHQPIEVKISTIQHFKVQIEAQPLLLAAVLGICSFLIVFIHHFSPESSFLAGPLFAYFMAIFYAFHFIVFGLILGLIKLRYRIDGDLDKYQIAMPRLQKYLVKDRKSQ